MKNTSKFDIDSQFAVSKLASKKFQIIIIVLGVIVSIVGLSTLKSSKEIGFGLIIGGVAVGIIYACFWNKILYKQVIKISQSYSLMSPSTIINYEFYEDSFKQIVYKNNELKESSTMNYSDLFKIEEDKDHLFLFVNVQNALIVDKNGMTEGSIEGLKNLIKTKAKNVKLK